MRRGRETRTAAVIAAAVLVALGGVTASLWAVAADGRMTLAAVLSAAVVVCFAVVGTVVALARPANRVGWLMLAGAALWAMGNAGTDLAYRGLVAAPGKVPGGSAWAISGSALRAVGWVVVTIGIPMVFPTGHSAGPHWRRLGSVATLAAASLAVGTVMTKDANVTDLGDWQNPLSTPVLNVVGGVLSLFGMACAAVGLIGAVLSLVHRWRRADAPGRQQLRLFAAAAVLPILTLPVIFVAANGAGWLFSAASLPLPIAIGFAILARGLYDLRTAANRTLVWVTLSVIVVTVYALVIAGVGSLVHAAGAAWLPWLAAAVVAVCFSPLRDLLQRGVNRLTFGRWDEPYAVLADIGQRLEGSTDVDRLLDDVVRDLRDGLRLSAVTIRDETGRAVAGGDAEPESTTLLLTAYGRIVGTLSYKLGEHPLRGRDLQLLDDLAAHLGGLLHARELTADLERARERLVLAREEERRRLRRDLHDGLGPALAGHILRLDLIGREVPPASAADAQIAALRDELQATVAEFRKVVEGLRPPALDDLGLADATRQMVRRVTAGSSAQVEIQIDDLPQLPAAVEVAVYRIAAEGVTNAVRHADADHITLAIIVAPARVTVEVDDDGSGMDDTAPGSGNGLETMRERAEELRGSLRVDSSAAGTKITAELPRPAAAPGYVEQSLLPAATA
ncbi:MAG TPA: histidine kinase [Jatrophihabitantaceae bacterium]|nr:histidine kinase [Jatrophihabitantaceae bacterium]